MIPRWLWVALVVALLLLGPVRSHADDARFIDYAVEWFEPTGRLIATGWLHLALVPEGPAGQRVVGHYRPDRRDEGAPPLSPQGSRVWGRVRGLRVELGMSIFLLDAVRIEAHLVNGDARRIQGQWRWSDSWSSRYGAWRAYAIGNSPSSRLRR
jgi:hypothetical protein